MSREIPLTQGYVALVDDEDFGWLSQRKWHAKTVSPMKTYAAANINGADIYMHRLILGSPANRYVDHRDWNCLNNQRANLRVATPAQNQANRASSASRSGFRGVSWSKETRKKWLARIHIGGKVKVLGYFATPREAALAYDRAAIETWGEFAATNAFLGKL